MRSPSPFSRQVDAHTELATRSKVALYLAEPLGEPIGIGECSPDVVDSGLEVVFHPHDAFAID